MSTVQTKNGKAFEYACLNAIFQLLSPTQEIIIERTSQLETAHKSFLSVSIELRDKLIMAANAATRVYKTLSEYSPS